jgi:hypothetical protein
MERDDAALVSQGIDLDRPNPARMYDYYLGGAHNFAPDRALAEQALSVMPWMREAVRANRAFLGRAVRYCFDQGIRQFLDLGSGIPTVGNVHEIAQTLDPRSRVAYVDNEAVAVAHSTQILRDNPNASITRADLTDSAAVLSAPTVTELIDFSQPVAVLAVAVLHFLPDERDPASVVRAYREAMSPGSYVVLSHVTSDHDPEEAANAKNVYQRSANPVHTRSHAEITALLHGFDLVEPGLVDATRWRPDESAEFGENIEHAGFYAAVGKLA